MVKVLSNIVVLYTNAIDNTIIVIYLMTGLVVIIDNTHAFLSECVQRTAGSFAVEAS